MRGDDITEKHQKNKHAQVLLAEELSWKQLDAFDRKKTMVFLPISPLEEHGPHLPVGTDLLTTTNVIKEVIKVLQRKKPELTFLLLPAVPLGYSKIAGDFPGTITIPVRTMKQVVYGICSSLAKQGFQYLVVCTYHMDLGHLKGIYAGIKKARAKFDMHIYEPFSPFYFQKEVEKREPKVGFDTGKEVHAGFRETSLMKYQYPYLVDASYKNLQSIYMDLYSPRVLGKTFQDLGLNDGYVGSPGRADSDYGRWLFQELVTLCVQSAIDLYEGKKLPGLPASTKRVMKSLFWL